MTEGQQHETQGKGGRPNWAFVVAVGLVAAAIALAFSAVGGPSSRGGAVPPAGSVSTTASAESSMASASSVPSRNPANAPNAAALPATTPPPPAAKPKKALIIAFQPAHQADTSNDPSFKEHIICGDIVDRAIVALPEYTCVKAWDIKDGLTGSNNYRPKPTNTKAFDKELAIANDAGADVFVAVHVDSGALDNWLLGEVLPRDPSGKALCNTLLGSLSKELGWKQRDPRVARLHSLEPSRNNAKYRCLLEIGDNEKDRAFLEVPANRERIAQALADGIRSFDAKY
jgi:hypothetical protein